jgi:peptide deformylase
MAKLEIICDGHPTLKKQAKSVRKMNDDLRLFADDMVETMIVSNGIGLAANQVNRTVRIIAVMHAQDDSRVYVNPRILKYSKEVQYGDEGCLSFPLLYGTVCRAERVTVQAQNLEMKKVKVDAEGLLARVFQHEIDHLNGITFTERAEPDTFYKITRQQYEEDIEDGEAQADESSIAIDDACAPDNSSIAE